MPHAVDNISKNRLSKKDRLKSTIEIEAVYHENHFVVAFPLKCYFQLSDLKTEKNAIQVAFAVPKKSFKHAVDRNTLKRRMREAYRLNFKKIFRDILCQEDKQLKLLIIYVSRELADYECIHKNIQLLLNKIDKKI